MGEGDQMRIVQTNPHNISYKFNQYIDNYKCRKAPKLYTFSPDDPKTSMELKLLGGNKNG